MPPNNGIMHDAFKSLDAGGLNLKCSNVTFARTWPHVGMFQDPRPHFHWLPVLAVAAVVVSIAAIVVYLGRSNASSLLRLVPGLQGRWKVLQDLSKAQALVLLQLCQFLGVQSIVD